MSARDAVAVGLLALVVGCGDEPGAPADASIPAHPADAPTPVAPPVTADVDDCAGCHPGTVARFASAHGMADSLGPVGELTPGSVTNPQTGRRYDVRVNDDGAAVLESHAPDGGLRRQLVVGRIGAGNKDVSLVTTELVGDQVTGHLFFAPVEWIVGHGWELSPFEVFGTDLGPDFGLETGCLQCHTGTGPASLPRAAAATDAPDDPWAPISPRNLLGPDAFDRLEALSCDACHGDTAAHAAAMAADPGGPLGIVRWDDRPLSARRDACARCHMDGEARVDLAALHGELPPDGRESLDLRPVAVTARSDDDFRFVAHHERLALSRCFTESDDMTCISCHAPHAGIAAQGTDAFDTRCTGCHDAADRAVLSAPSASRCNRPDDLAVRDVTGAAPRGEAGCVDCHVRRSQPFDLGHVAVADHFVRRAIPRAETVPLRPFHDPDGQLVVFPHGGYDGALDTPAGERWARGVVGMAYVKQGRFAEADAAFSAFTVPEHPDALVPTAPPGLEPLETSPAFHHVRGLVAEHLGRAADAERSYRHALQLDPTHASARLNLAGLLLARGELAGTRDALTALLDRYPASAKAWNLMARFGARVGDLPGAASALARSVSLWPSDATVHRELARLLDELGDETGAELARRRARALSPTIADQR